MAIPKKKRSPPRKRARPPKIEEAYLRYKRLGAQITQRLIQMAKECGLTTTGSSKTKYGLGIAEHKTLSVKLVSLSVRPPSSFRSDLNAIIKLRMRCSDWYEPYKETPHWKIVNYKRHLAFILIMREVRNIWFGTPLGYDTAESEQEELLSRAVVDFVRHPDPYDEDDIMIPQADEEDSTDEEELDRDSPSVMDCLAYCSYNEDRAHSPILLIDPDHSMSPLPDEDDSADEGESDEETPGVMDCGFDPRDSYYEGRDVTAVFQHDDHHDMFLVAGEEDGAEEGESDEESLNVIGYRHSYDEDHNGHSNLPTEAGHIIVTMLPPGDEYDHSDEGKSDEESSSVTNLVGYHRRRSDNQSRDTTAVIPAVLRPDDHNMGPPSDEHDSADGEESEEDSGVMDVAGARHSYGEGRDINMICLADDNDNTGEESDKGSPGPCEYHSWYENTVNPSLPADLVAGEYDSADDSGSDEEDFVRYRNSYDEVDPTLPANTDHAALPAAEDDSASEGDSETLGVNEYRNVHGEHDIPSGADSNTIRQTDEDDSGDDDSEEDDSVGYRDSYDESRDIFEIDYYHSAQEQEADEDSPGVTHHYLYDQSHDADVNTTAADEYNNPDEDGGVFRYRYPYNEDNAINVIALNGAAHKSLPAADSDSDDSADESEEESLVVDFADPDYNMVPQPGEDARAYEEEYCTDVEVSDGDESSDEEGRLELAEAQQIVEDEEEDGSSVHEEGIDLENDRVFALGG
ncbi:hypothetical protein B0H16DRAFT_1716388 [Mycena metata]|uniref:DUF6604 domain-containing protein n=1 Tax=Mycena metata TaxID=1033252 RepID=A0AAD7JQE1_9AGAR|nr:hypothetical protein B0H16DRAFT_1716388 [Mycena metata]